MSINFKLCRFQLKNARLIRKTKGNIIIDFNVEKKTVSSFYVIDQHVTEPEDMVAYLLEIVSMATHPAIHAHNDRFYRENRHKADLIKYDKIFQYGQSINESSVFWPGYTFGIDPSTCKAILIHNGSLLQPASHPTGVLMNLTKYSRSARYMLAARAILFRLVRKYKVVKFIIFRK